MNVLVTPTLHRSLCCAELQGIRQGDPKSYQNDETDTGRDQSVLRQTVPG